MKTKAFLSASRLAIMALALSVSFCFIACGGDDGELSVDELLSEETTPITFGLTKKGTHYLFDYAGSNLVNSDTIEVEYLFQQSYKKDLRQGKHRLLWMRGLRGATQSVNYGGKVDGVDYDPSTGLITLQGEDVELYPKPQYCVKEIEVTPYLMPEQKVDYNHLCTTLAVSLNSSPLLFSMVYIYNIPFVSAVGIEDNRYEVQYCQKKADFESSTVSSYWFDILCPKDGLKDIQLEYEIFVFHDNQPVSFYKQRLPKVTLQRGVTTKITGHLGGKTEDFEVTTSEYGEGY